MIRLRDSVYGVEAGKRFRERTVLGTPFSRGLSRSGQIYWAVVTECECGRIQVTPCGSLAYSGATSCRNCGISKANRKHGHTANGVHTKLYQCWCGLRARCNNSNDPAYANYGGRGISVCHEWSAFETFKQWAVTNGYVEGLEIDRIDNNGGYQPHNCRWVTSKQNSRNRRSSRMLTAFGETKSLVEWVEDHRCNVKQVTLISRLNLSWDVELAIMKPAREYVRKLSG